MKRSVTKRRPASRPTPLPKAPTGITGLDEITQGGLPRGRPTLLCGAAGCGKTLLAMEYLVRGAVEFDEPGVFVTFEERTADLIRNFASFGHDLDRLIARRKLTIDYVHVERSEIEVTGSYDLDGLFIRLAHAVDTIGARRVVLDTIETLFSGLTDTAVLRAEIRRLFRWLKDRELTAVITGERGDGTRLTRYGLEEYVADCVILLDHRVAEQMATRRLRIVKYRGSDHGGSEYPFLITDRGMSILPITSATMTHSAPTDQVSTGIPQLDALMAGGGYFRGSSVLVSGTAGTGKTSLAAHFAHAATGRGERCLWLAFEESSDQIVRNMRSIAIDLAPAMQRGLLRIHPERPTVHGLESHLLTMHDLVGTFAPRVVVIDPITNFVALGNAAEIKAMLTRLIDFFKMQTITTFFTSLTSGGGVIEATDVGVSSLMDTWLLLRDQEQGIERNRVLAILKSRGMAHSKQLHEFVLTDRGVVLRDVGIGSTGELLLGTARAIQAAQEEALAVVRGQPYAHVAPRHNAARGELR